MGARAGTIAPEPAWAGYVPRMVCLGAAYGRLVHGGGWAVCVYEFLLFWQQLIFN